MDVIVGRIYLADENNRLHLQGEQSFDKETKREEIIKTLIDKYWDSRLYSAGCCPLVDIPFDKED